MPCLPCCAALELRPLRSTSVIRLPCYCWPLRHPDRPGLPLSGLRLARATPPTGFRCCVPYALSCVPPPLPRRNRPVHTPLASRPMPVFPVRQAGRLSHHNDSRRAQPFTRVAARMVAEPPWALSQKPQHLLVSVFAIGPADHLTRGHVQRREHMPVIVAPEDFDAWLAGDAVTLRPTAGLCPRRAGSHVNDARHDDARCVEPADAV